MRPVRSALTAATLPPIREYKPIIVITRIPAVPNEEAVRTSSASREKRNLFVFPSSQPLTFRGIYISGKNGCQIKNEKKIIAEKEGRNK